MRANDFFRFALLSALSACGGQAAPAGPSTGGGRGDAGVPDAGSDDPAPPIDLDDPCRSLTAPDMPAARAVWLSLGDQELTVSGEALDWAFRYAVSVPAAQSADYKLEYSRCARPGAQPEQCDPMMLSVPDGCAVAFIRDGVDSTQYLPGDNVFTYFLRLYLGQDAVSESRFSILIHDKP